MELEFAHAGTTLAGTVELSNGEVCAAAVFAHGSGAATRDAWRTVALRLADTGIASLRYDKPGCGASAGDWTAQTFEDRADETLTALAALRRSTDVPVSCAGIIGGSQGGWIATLAATRSDDVGFAVCLSAAGVTPAEQEAFRIERQGAADGLPPEQVEAAVRLFARRLESMRNGASAEEIFEQEAEARREPWFPLVGDETVAELGFDLAIYDFDAAAVLARVSCPILAIWGGDDVVVPVDQSVAAFEASTLAAGRTEDERHVIPGVGHALRRPGADERVPELYAFVIPWVTRICDRVTAR